MKKFLLFLLVFMLYVPSVNANILSPEKISKTTFIKTDIAVFKQKILFTENNEYSHYLKIYDANSKTSKLLASSSVPFEYISLNDSYAVWSQRSTTFVQKGTFWYIKAYNFRTGKIITLADVKKYNKYPLLSGDNLVYYESDIDGVYPRLIKVNIPTGLRNVLLANMQISSPAVLGNLLLFTTDSSKLIYVLNIDTKKIIRKIDSGSEMNVADFTDLGIIWSSSNQENSTSSALYEYSLATGKVSNVIKGLSWGKGHNYISPIRINSTVFYLSGDDASGLDLWMQDLKSGGQLSLATNVIKFDSSSSIVAFIKDKNVLYFKLEDNNYFNTSVNSTSDGNAFPDLNKHWAKDIIIKLKNLNIITGDKSQSGKLFFRPNENISRGEFATMLCLTLKIPGVSGKNTLFRDINKHWALPFINSLYKKGVIQGKNENNFLPNDPISRAEATVMMSRSKKWTYGSKITPFKDVPISHWAYAPITQMRFNKVIVGKSNELFEPNAKLTRAESAVLMYNLLKK